MGIETGYQLDDLNRRGKVLFSIFRLAEEVGFFVPSGLRRPDEALSKNLMGALENRRKGYAMPGFHEEESITDLLSYHTVLIRSHCSKGQDDRSFVSIVMASDVSTLEYCIDSTNVSANSMSTAFGLFKKYLFKMLPEIVPDHQHRFIATGRSDNKTLNFSLFYENGRVFLDIQQGSVRLSNLVRNHDTYDIAELIDRLIELEDVVKDNPSAAKDSMLNQARRYRRTILSTRLHDAVVSLKK